MTKPMPRIERIRRQADRYNPSKDHNGYGYSDRWRDTHFLLGIIVSLKSENRVMAEQLGELEVLLDEAVEGQGG